ncbi:unnamed protein product [Polarella glacialis]|uniref:Uncharacterized protein n=1 Tax=Polarella glacialis TaxID=89957 RepID=A0A813GDA3_POLGL|nr:unnamed protein product [Polarella glacialis]
MAPHTVEPMLAGDQSSEEESSSEEFSADSDCCFKSWDLDGVEPEQRTAAGLARMQYTVFLSHFFVHGLVMGGLSATGVGVFYSYLHIPNYIFSAYFTIMNLPTMFGFFFGLLSDSRPIYGLRRKPYMVLGWAICSIVLVIAAAMKMPEPYYCVGEDGNYDKSVPPCNPTALHSATPIIACLALSILGVVIAEAAANGLMVEYTKQESEEKRGSTVSLVAMASNTGRGISTIIVGVAFNSKLYNGSFDWGLSFNQVCMICGTPAVILCLSLISIGVQEDAVMLADKISFRGALKSAWNGLRTKAVFCLVMFISAHQIVGGINTTASTSILVTWAGQRQLQRVLFSTAGYALVVGSVWMVRRYFLESSWRKMLIISTISMPLIDAVPTFLTIFDVIRNQYFFMGEELLTKIPIAFNSVVYNLIVAELADEGSEALFFGLVMSIRYLLDPVSSVLSNQIFGMFHPDLSDQQNYIDDTPAFRRTVALSYVVGYVCSFLCLLFFGLIPDQKSQAQQWKRYLSARDLYAYVALVPITVAFAYAIVVLVLTLDSATACLTFVGGQGC